MANATITVDVDAAKARQKYEQLVREISTRPVNLPLNSPQRPFQVNAAPAGSTPAQQRAYYGTQYQTALGLATTGQERIDILGQQVLDNGGVGSPGAAQAQYALSRELLAQQRASRPGGLFGPGTVGYSAAARFIGPAAVVAGIEELAGHVRGKQEASYALRGADTYAQANQARIQGIRSLQGGLVGNLYTLYADNLTSQGPTAIIGQLEANTRFNETSNRLAGTGDDLAASAAVRYGYRTGGDAGARRSEIASQSVRAQEKLRRTNRELEEQNREDPTYGSGQGSRESFRRSSEIRRNNLEIGDLEDDRRFQLQRLDDQDRLDRLGITNQTAGFNDVTSGLTPREQQRAELVRRGGQALAAAAQRDRRRLGIVGENVRAEAQAFDFNARREDRFADTLNNSASAAAYFAAGNDPLRARLAAASGRNAVELERAEPGQRSGIASRQTAETAQVVAETLRQVTYQQAALRGQSNVLTAQLGRDPLGGTLAGIRAQTDDQLRGADSLPDTGGILGGLFGGYSPRRAVQGSIRGVGAQREALARQTYGDEVLQSRAALAFGNESLGILAKNDGSSYGDRARRAETNDIVRQAQLDQVRAATAGRPDLIGGIQQRGRLQLENQAQQYLAGLRPVEVNLNKVAGSSDAGGVLDQIDRAKNKLGDGPRDQTLTPENLEQLLQRVIDSAVTKLDRVR